MRSLMMIMTMMIMIMMIMMIWFEAEKSVQQKRRKMEKIFFFKDAGM